MFTCKYDIQADGVECEPALFYTKDSLTLRITADEPLPIEIGPEGSTTYNPSNGSFSLRWDAKEFVFFLGQHSWQGGQFLITVKNTPQLFSSFIIASRVWNVLLAKN